jgi:hypothetical protein
MPDFAGFGVGCDGREEVTENKKAAIRFSPMAASKGGRGKLDLRKLEAPKT